MNLASQDAVAIPRTVSASLPLSLRVVVGPRQGEVISLVGAKCSIGGSDRCTLRITGRGVRPLHCLVLRGAERTIIRKWSPDTWLNGKDFSDAPLVVGDRLRIGPVELEVLSTEISQPAAAAAVPRWPAQSQPTEAVAVSAAATIRDSQRRWRTRTQRVLAQARALQERADELSQLMEQRGATTDELDRRRAELDARAAELEQWSAGLDRRDHELNQHGDLLNQKGGELEALRATLDSRQSELAQAEHDWQSRFQSRDADQAHREREAAERSDHLRDEAARVAAERESLVAERERWAAERTEADESASRRADKIESLRRELDEARESIAQQRSAWEDQQRSGKLPELEERERRVADHEDELARRRHDLEVSGADLARRTEQLDRRCRELDEAQAAFSQTRDEWTEKLPQQHAEMARAREAFDRERTEFHAARDAFESSSRETASELDRRQAEIDAALTQSADERQRLEADQESWRGERGRQQAQLDHRAEQIEKEEQALASERELGEAEKTRQQAELDAIATRVEQSRAHLEADREAFTCTRDEWSDRYADELRQLEDRGRRLDRRDAELTAAKEAFEEQIRDDQGVDRERADTLPAGAWRESAEIREPVEPTVDDVTDESSAHEDVEFERPSTDSPVSAASLLGRLGFRSNSDEDDRQARAQRATVPRSEYQTPAPATEPPHASAATGDEDDDAHAYVARLIANQKSTKPSAPVYDSSESRQKTEPVAPPPTPVVQAPAAPESYEPPKPRRIAPELSADIAAMRELANLSARSAVDRHARRQLAYMTLGKTIVVVTGLVVGGVLFSLWTKGVGLAIYPAVVSFGVAAFWGVQLALAVRFLRTAFGTRSSHASSSAVEADAVAARLESIEATEEPFAQPNDAASETEADPIDHLHS